MAFLLAKTPTMYYYPDLTLAASYYLLHKEDMKRAVGIQVSLGSADCLQKG